MCSIRPWPFNCVSDDPTDPKKSYKNKTYAKSLIFGHMIGKLLNSLFPIHTQNL